MSQDFDFFGLQSDVMISREVLLSVLIGVGGWGCPIAIRSARMATAFWLFLNIPPVSASAAEETTFRSALHSTVRAPLRGGGFGFAAVGALPREKSPAQWPRA